VYFPYSLFFQTADLDPLAPIFDCPFPCGTTSTLKVDDVAEPFGLLFFFVFLTPLTYDNIFPLGCSCTSFFVSDKFFAAFFLLPEQFFVPAFSFPSDVSLISWLLRVFGERFLLFFLRPLLLVFPQSFPFFHSVSLFSSV